MSLRFTTIIMQEGKWYVARCVELGVVSQGKNITEAQRNLREAVELYLEDQPRTEVKRFISRSAPLITTFEIEHA